MSKIKNFDPALYESHFEAIRSFQKHSLVLVHKQIGNREIRERVILKLA